MIQRVQTIYLLLAVVFMLLFYIFPIATFTTDIFAFEFFNCHITHPENLQPPLPLLPLAILPLFSIIGSFVAIFMYKNRKSQRRLGKINMMTVFTVIIITVFYFFKIKDFLDGTVQYGFAAIFPVLVFVMLAFANKAIKKDDDLVRAADRIRS